MRLLKIALIVFVSSSLVAYNGDVFAKGAKSSKSSHRGKAGRKGKADAGDVWTRIRQGIRIPRPSPAPAGFGELPGLSTKITTGASGRDVKTSDALRIADEELARLNTVITPKKLPQGKSQLSEKLRSRQEISPGKDTQDNPESVNSEQKYTPLGRLKFAKKEAANSATESLSKKLHIVPKEKMTVDKDDGAFKSPTVQRIRTRLGLHPELFKDGVVPTDEALVSGSKKTKKSDLSRHPNTQNAAISSCADLKKDAVISLAQQGILADSYALMAEECRARQNEKVARVNKHIAGYSRGYLYHVSERARPYLFHIVDALSKYGLPLDLALLPIVESAYQPTALSPMNAAGIWQFIPSTGREFGMEQTEVYDGRLDVTASTQAAIRFLSGLNAHFKGDWLLALAAYNSGQGTVDAAIARNQAEGLDTDFWSLDLPAETKDYVPRLLALATIFQNPGGHGLKLRPLRNEPHFIKVNIDREADIKQLVNKDLKSIAKLANFDPEEFGLLNSAYLKANITQQRPFTLLMPISNANLLHQSLAFMAQSYKDDKAANPALLAKLPSAEPILPKPDVPLLSMSLNDDLPWLPSTKKPITFNVQSNKPTDDKADGTTKFIAGNWAVHYLDKGETLKAVAEYHGLTEGELREFNKLKRKQTASLGQRILVPLKQIVAGIASKKSHPSVLFKAVTDTLDPLQLRL